MKARIKETGEVIDFKGCSIEHGICTWIGSDNMINQRPMPPGGIEILEKNSDFNSIDWEQRRYELAKSAMQGILCAPIVEGIDPNPTPWELARISVRNADALIKELKKGE